MSVSLSSLVVVAAAQWGVNSFWLMAVTVVWLVVAYWVYGKRIERRLVGPTDAPTPADAQRDDVDYYPAKRIVLFGHHFASIAGAGPILGPVLAVAFFGWGLTALWILVGVVLIGAVHDYLALMISVRHGGSSLPDVAREAVSGPARILFLIFVWIGLVLVITAFANAAANTFLAETQAEAEAEAPADEDAAAPAPATAATVAPAEEGAAAAAAAAPRTIDTGTRVLVPTFLLMLIAVFFGVMTKRWRMNTALATAIALVLLLGAFVLGFLVPEGISQLGLGDADPEQTRLTPKTVWLVILLAYGVVASVLPVWVLLQPRDYLATWILILGMALGLTGVVVQHPALSVPVYTEATTAKGPIWPMLFIIVACGAVSGFHCLVAGGTTSKQLAREGHGLAVGYGSMLTEGVLAMLAVIAVGAGLAFGAAGTSVAGDGTLHGFLAAGGAGPIAAFGKGFDYLTRPLLRPVGQALGIEAFGMIVGVTMVNAFVMTTLDTAVRLARFITSELLSPYLPVFKNRLVASLLAVIPAFFLAVGGAFKAIWPMFGAANQLIAALALIVITAWLLKRGKPTLYTLIPAVFMLVTTLAALLWQAYSFLIKAEKPDYTLGITALVLLALALVVAIQGLLVRREPATAAQT